MRQLLLVSAQAHCCVIVFLLCCRPVPCMSLLNITKAIFAIDVSKAPKDWHAYVKAHLFHTLWNNFLRNGPMTHGDIVKNLQVENAQTNDFKGFVKKYKVFLFQKPPHSSDKMLPFTSPIFFIMLNKSSFSPSTLSKLSFYREELWRPRIVWFSLLDSKFCAKFSVLSLSVPTKNIQNCIFGHIKFYKCDKQIKEHHTFCGAHSALDLFLHNRRVCFFAETPLYFPLSEPHLLFSV